MTDEERALLAGMKRAGMTTKQIAARLGWTPGRVQREALKLKAYARLDHKPGRLHKSPAPTLFKDEISPHAK